MKNLLESRSGPGQALLLISAFFTLSAAGAPVRVAELPISVVSISSPVSAKANATIFIRTSPGARCWGTVDYKSAGTKPRKMGPLDLDPQIADMEGRAAWRWPVDERAVPGRWPIVVTCEKGGTTRELRTHFEIR
jgi:hypothetical protein